MRDQNSTDDPEAALTHQLCYYLYFGLIVTGKGEREHLPKLFRSLTATGICNFEVICFTGQRGPITSTKRQLKMVGKGKIIPDRDATQIGFPARNYLKNDGCRFVMLVDDLEYDRREYAQQIFERYRQALDTVLTPDQRRRVAVHFLVYMLEAYYFADANAINLVLELNPALEDSPGDVETIPHPKGELKRLFPGFNEISHGGRILDHLNVEHILSRPEACASLRTLFAWCSKVLTQYTDPQIFSIPDKYRLQDGQLSDITGIQLDSV